MLNFKKKWKKWLHLVVKEDIFELNFLLRHSRFNGWIKQNISDDSRSRGRWFPRTKTDGLIRYTDQCHSNSHDLIGYPRTSVTQPPSRFPLFPDPFRQKATEEKQSVELIWGRIAVIQEISVFNQNTSCWRPGASPFDGLSFDGLSIFVVTSYVSVGQSVGW